MVPLYTARAEGFTPGDVVVERRACGMKVTRVICHATVSSCPSAAVADGL
jgi:hypothetical protein